MKIIRWIVGKILLFVNWLTFPKPGHRSEADQQKVNEASKSYALYEFKSCPFCVKVRRSIQRLNLPIELKDAKNNEISREELLTNGGKAKVPCLRYQNENGTDTWLYESNDIIKLLEERFPI